MPRLVLPPDTRECPDCEKPVTSATVKPDGRCPHCQHQFKAPPALPPIFSDWHDWLKHLPESEETTSKNTLRAYSQGLRRLIVVLGIDPGQFGPQHLNEVAMIDAVGLLRSHSEVSKAGRNQTLAAVASFFDFCLLVNADLERHGDDSRWSDKPYRKHIRGWKRPDLERIRKLAPMRAAPKYPAYFLAKELYDLYEAAEFPTVVAGEPGFRVRWPGRDLAMFIFLGGLGLRSSELCDLTVGSIRQQVRSDPDDLRLQVVGKGKKFRSLPLTESQIEATRRWLAERTATVGPPEINDPLFITIKRGMDEKIRPILDKKQDSPTYGRPLGFSYRQLRHWMACLMRLAQVPEGDPPRALHSLRHTAGVLSAARGVKINEIQAVLGHEEIATAAIYMKLVESVDVGVIEKSEADSVLREVLELKEERAEEERAELER